MWKKIGNFLLNLFFPKFCFSCQKEGSYLCEDCRALLDISSLHQVFKTDNLDDLYFAFSYKNPLGKKILQKFKYFPFVKELAGVLSSFIIDHFKLIEKSPESFKEFIILSVPQTKKRLKWRGFNQSAEIGKGLAKYFNIEFFENVLVKTKETERQVELSATERKENIKGAFSIKNNDLIKNRKIILVDDIYTTGSTMEEAAKILKNEEAKEVIGVVVARAEPGEDKIEDFN